VHETETALVAATLPTATLPAAPLAAPTLPAVDCEQPANSSPGASPSVRREGWAARALATLTDACGRRKRIVVGTEPGARALARSVDAVRIVESDGMGVQLMERLQREAPDDVYFDLGTGIDEHVMARVGARLLMDGIAVHFVLPDFARPPVRAASVRIGSHSVISLHAVPDSLLSRGIRRAIDILGGAALLLFLSPVFALVALLVWARMGRPIIHVQQRVGRSGHLFGLYKFRSMVAGAEQMLRVSPELYERYVASNFKVPAEEDARITPLGRFLRRASLDELPQLWNVLKGEMSLVGPRAIVPDELASYGDYARMLLRVKPGLTGFWQVTGRSSIGYPERARMDLQYVGRRLLREDLRILLRTLPAVLQQRGAL
jgi:lipopolysaccharide/colanic/teichoic acid biosynthesis glycosyltransferase